MSQLLLDRADLEVRTEGQTLVLYENGQRRGTVPLALIDRCVIQGQGTRLDSGVLLKLAEVGATTVLMSPRQPRRVALVLGPQHNEASVRIAQAQRVMDSVACVQWAVALVRAKLRRQLHNLRQWQRHRPDARHPLSEAIATVQAIAYDLRQTRTDGLDPAAAQILMDTVRGQEGAAARAYFAGLAAVCPPSLNFTGRNRRPPRDPVNVCLSLGYTLLHSQAIAACQMAGLDPLLGFYHRPAFGRESLASDLIEPMRPVLDWWAWELVRSRTLREDHFTYDKGACLLGKAGRSVFYASWERDSQAQRRWLRQQTRLLARQLREQGLPWLAAADEEEEQAS